MTTMGTDWGEIPHQQADPGELTYSDALEAEIGQAEIPVTNHFTPPPQAVPVFERAALSHSTRLNVISSTQMLIGRRPGRKYVVLGCPSLYNGSTNTLGFQVSDDRAYIDGNVGLQVNPGDSVEIDSEAPVWVGPTAGNATAVVQWSEVFNPNGGYSGL